MSFFDNPVKPLRLAGSCEYGRTTGQYRVVPDLRQFPESIISLQGRCLLQLHNGNKPRQQGNAGGTNKEVC